MKLSHFLRKSILIPRGQQTAPFRVRIRIGRLGIPPREPRTKVRVGSIIFVLLLAFVLAWDSGCLNSAQQNGSSEPAMTEAQRPAYRFPPGERIVFGVYSNGLKIGSGNLWYQGPEMSGGDLGQHIVLSVSTLSVKDTDHVYGVFETAMPFLVQRDVKLPGRHEEIIEQYDQAKKTVSIRKTDKKGRVTTQTLSSDMPLDNVLLLVYGLRNDEQLSVGKTYVLNLPTRKFTLTVKDKRKIKVPLGLFNAYLIESNPPKYKLWISADEKRIPVRIQGLVFAGMVYFAATEISHP